MLSLHKTKKTLHLLKTGYARISWLPTLLALFPVPICAELCGEGDGHIFTTYTNERLFQHCRFAIQYTQMERLLQLFCGGAAAAADSVMFL
jgi:hypothetical protein